MQQLKIGATYIHFKGHRDRVISLGKHSETRDGKTFPRFMLEE